MNASLLKESKSKSSTSGRYSDVATTGNATKKRALSTNVDPQRNPSLTSAGGTRLTKKSLFSRQSVIESSSSSSDLLHVRRLLCQTAGLSLIGVVIMFGALLNIFFGMTTVVLIS